MERLDKFIKRGKDLVVGIKGELFPSRDQLAQDTLMEFNSGAGAIVESDSVIGIGIDGRGRGSTRAYSVTDRVTQTNSRSQSEGITTVNTRPLPVEAVDSSAEDAASNQDSDELIFQLLNESAEQRAERWRQINSKKEKAWAEAHPKAAAKKAKG
jgi:hypothetical protein